MLTFLSLHFTFVCCSKTIGSVNSRKINWRSFGLISFVASLSFIRQRKRKQILMHSNKSRLLLYPNRRKISCSISLSQLQNPPSVAVSHCWSHFFYQHFWLNLGDLFGDLERWIDTKLSCMIGRKVLRQCEWPSKNLFRLSFFLLLWSFSTRLLPLCITKEKKENWVIKKCLSKKFRCRRFWFDFPFSLLSIYWVD